ncbi:MAG: hypothetical protein HYW00_01025 [Candidatus Colwellbacteria bacterium]|nr:hypothetical protein [Candidatus Colwellbacteria bacterium]
MPLNKKIIFVFVLVLVISISFFIFFIGRREKVPEITNQTSQTSPYTGGIKTGGPPLDEYISQRPPLSPEKQKLKEKLVAPLGGAGSFVIAPEYRIDYLPAPDIFEVEIKDTNIDDVKNRVIAWFKQQGFNEEDICNLPVTFYLSGEVVQQYEGSGLVFYPIPDFCQ